MTADKRQRSFANSTKKHRSTVNGGTVIDCEKLGREKKMYETVPDNYDAFEGLEAEQQR